MVSVTLRRGVKGVSEGCKGRKSLEQGRGPLVPQKWSFLYPGHIEYIKRASFIV